MKLVYAHKYFLHLRVEPRGGAAREFTAIYASPKSHIRRFLWEKLDEMEIKGHWVVLSDFNCVLHEEERNTGSDASCGFIDWVERRGLIDHGFSGSPFTWSHGVQRETRKSARLDRALCNEEWRRAWPVEVVRHLTHAHLDHCPILLKLDGTKSARLFIRVPSSLDASP